MEVQYIDGCFSLVPQHRCHGPFRPQNLATIAMTIIPEGHLIFDASVANETILALVQMADKVMKIITKRLLKMKDIHSTSTPINFSNPFPLPATQVDEERTAISRSRILRNQNKAIVLSDYQHYVRHWQLR